LQNQTQVLQLFRVSVRKLSLDPLGSSRFYACKNSSVAGEDSRRFMMRQLSYCSDHISNYISLRIHNKCSYISNHSPVQINSRTHMELRSKAFWPMQRLFIAFSIVFMYGVAKLEHCFTVRLNRSCVRACAIRKHQLHDIYTLFTFGPMHLPQPRRLFTRTAGTVGMSLWVPL
jgi:hypothetical protein